MLKLTTKSCVSRNVTLPAIFFFFFFPLHGIRYFQPAVAATKTWAIPQRLLPKSPTSRAACASSSRKDRQWKYWSKRGFTKVGLTIIKSVWGACTLKVVLHFWSFLYFFYLHIFYNKNYKYTSPKCIIIQNLLVCIALVSRSISMNMNERYYILKWEISEF